MSVEISAQWLAGFFDGEGCVQYWVKGRVTDSFLSITNTDVRPLLACQEKYGGRVDLLVKPKLEARNCWIFQISGKNAERMAQDILPFSIIKERQLRLWLKARQNLKSGKPVTDEELSKRKMWQRKIRHDKRIEFSRSGEMI